MFIVSKQTPQSSDMRKIHLEKFCSEFEGGLGRKINSVSAQER
jgi:hypothetical protein